MCRLRVLQKELALVSKEALLVAKNVSGVEYIEASVEKL
jgi:hypothetical protein